MFKYDLVAALQYSTPTLYGEGIVVFDIDTSPETMFGNIKSIKKISSFGIEYQYRSIDQIIILDWVMNYLVLDDQKSETICHFGI